MPEESPPRPPTLLESMQRIDPALLRLLLFVGALVGVLVILIVFDQIFMPLLLGMAVAYICDPAVSWFEKRGWSRLFGVIVMTLVVLVVLVGIFLYLIPAIGAQLDRLGESLPEYRERLEKQLQPWMLEIQERYPDELATFEERARAAVTENLPNVAEKLGRGIRNLFGNLFRLLLFLLNLVFVPVFAFYLLVDWPKLKSAVSDLLPVAYRGVILERVGEVNQAVSAFVRGQLTIAVILATINATGLVLLDVPMGLAIGILAGLANMIPYMALVVGLAPALLLCWVEHGSWPLMLGVVAVFSGAQMLEGMVLSPRILGKSVNLHPVWVLLAVIAGGSLFGFFGMLLAVPVAAAIQVFVRHWIKLYRSSRIYGAEG